jgi:hypothetical protein
MVGILGESERAGRGSVLARECGVAGGGVDARGVEASSGLEGVVGACEDGAVEPEDGDATSAEPPGDGTTACGGTAGAGLDSRTIPMSTAMARLTTATRSGPSDGVRTVKA